jgi:hypothetical protein
VIKKSYIPIILLFFPVFVYGDVIFPAPEYAGLAYSMEVIYNQEKIRTLNRTVCHWLGIGMIIPHRSPDHYFFGFEDAYEGRYYFGHNYKGLFVSYYAGIAVITDFTETVDLGLVPGIKLNWKIIPNRNTSVEPYLGISVPFAAKILNWFVYIPIPTLTVGIRIGWDKLFK